MLGRSGKRIGGGEMIKPTLGKVIIEVVIPTNPERYSYLSCHLLARQTAQEAIRMYVGMTETASRDYTLITLVKKYDDEVDLSITRSIRDEISVCILTVREVK